MNILYGIQGTGNGHISRAGAILPELRKYATVHTLVSGSSNETAGGIQPDIRLHGIGFTFGKTGGIDFADTINRLRPATLLNNILDLPLEQYDLIISDFEPVTAWAGKLRGIPVVGLSHQAAFHSARSPRPTQPQHFGELIFRKYAPADIHYGFHFETYDEGIFTPVIRNAVRDLNPTDDGHITVYLPAYSSDALLPLLTQIERPVHLFAKHELAAGVFENVQIYPVDNDLYLQSLESCSALVCGAGFEAPSEALFLGKRLFCIPMSGQYEQQCNAAALQQIGASVAKSADNQLPEMLGALLNEPSPEPIDYPDIVPDVVEHILDIIPKKRIYAAV